jgi:hypothetical protein
MTNAYECNVFGRRNAQMFARGRNAAALAQRLDEGEVGFEARRRPALVREFGVERPRATGGALRRFWFSGGFVGAYES